MEEVISCTASYSSDDEGSADPAEALFQRGSYLRSLRELERQDEAERHQHPPPPPSASATSSGGDVKDDTITLSSPSSKDTNGEIVQLQLLQYNRYLQHQRYYDDLKHVDCQYIEYTVQASSLSNPNSSGNDNADDDFPPPPPFVWLPLIVEQDKSLGKGGLCWDAAFILAEYLAVQHSWERVQCNNNRPLRILELGAGTGLCGLYLAMHLSNNNNNRHSNNIEIALTDLPPLLPLLQRNIHRNFAISTLRPIHDKIDSTVAEKKESLLQRYLATSTAASHSGTTSHPCGCQVTASVLPWGDLRAEAQHGQFDLVLGADVVASLYDPVALAQCLYRMLRCDGDGDDDNSKVYIAFKERLSTRHRQFEAELARWFETVTVVDPLPLWPASSWQCRNRNPDVKILVAQGKRNEPRD